MTLFNFEETLKEEVPPITFSDFLKSLWQDGKGNWDIAHDIADNNASQESAWIHAYLHRKEGDNWNANYWYRRAGRKMPNLPLEKEWENLVEFFLKNHHK